MASDDDPPAPEAVPAPPGAGAGAAAEAPPLTDLSAAAAAAAAVAVAADVAVVVCPDCAPAAACSSFARRRASTAAWFGGMPVALRRSKWLRGTVAGFMGTTYVEGWSEVEQ